LDRRRIYILPTRQGYAFAVLLLCCFCGPSTTATAWASPSPSCWPAVALNSMWQAHDNLLGLIIHPGCADPVFVGQDAQFGPSGWKIPIPSRAMASPCNGGIESRRAM
jgi:hypothetical protein